MEQLHKKLTILHFNDVYNIEEKKTEPLGGVARFKTALDSFSEENPLTLFSGDLFQPSLLSTAYDGEQMIKPLNDMKVDVACFGNHEFDLDLDMLTDYIERMNFPWLISNVKFRADMKPVASGKESIIIEKNGFKIGFMGLAEGEWVHEVSALDMDEIMYEDFIKCAKRLTKQFREKDNCDMVIALTHLRLYNDKRLAQEFDGLDLILGGHDHINIVEKVNGTYVVKSGSDFAEFYKIDLAIPTPEELGILSEEAKAELYKGKYTIGFKNIHVTAAYEPNLELQEYVRQHMAEFEVKMKIPVLHSSVELETRFEKVRMSEQNFPNLLTDIVRLDSGCEVALINSGTFRANRVFEPGVLTLGDIRLILPWEDLIMKVRMTGEQLYHALENGVSTYPVLDGRFNATSGVTFAFDPSKEPMKRIQLDTVLVKGKPIEMERSYTVATMLFIYHGNGGNHIFKEVESLHEEELAEEVHTLLKKLFSLTKDPNVRDASQMVHHDVLADPSFLKPPTLGRRLSEIKRMDFFDKLKPLIKNMILHEDDYLISVEPTIENRVVVLKPGEIYKPEEKQV